MNFLISNREVVLKKSIVKKIILQPREQQGFC